MSVTTIRRIETFLSVSAALRHVCAPVRGRGKRNIGAVPDQECRSRSVNADAWLKRPELQIPPATVSRPIAAKPAEMAAAQAAMMS